MNRTLRIGLVAVCQLALVGTGVAPQLSAHLRGETYLLRVAPLDPIDPFRGAYVALDYPDLAVADDASQNSAQGATPEGPDDEAIPEPERGALYLSLVEQDGVWVATTWSRTRPENGPYLACDDRSWQVRCGIESFFLPQDKALETERLLGEGAVAEVRIDSRGNASVSDVRAR